MENKIIYRADWATFNREKFIKPIIITSLFLLGFILCLFNPTLKPYVFFGIMACMPTLLALLLIYFNRPSRDNDSKENVYVQFNNDSLRVSLRKESNLYGDMKTYLIDEIDYPKITYQVFEIPYSEITCIKESGGSGLQNPYYRICYISSSNFTKIGIYIPKNVFGDELRQELIKLGNAYNIKTFR